MSWWVFRKDKLGRWNVWLIDVDPLLIVALLGVSIGVSLTWIQWVVQNPMPAAVVSSEVMLLGYVCLVIAKVSLIRRGIWTSWGSRLMSRNLARLHRAAYGLMLSGGAMLLLIWRLAA